MERRELFFGHYYYIAFRNRNRKSIDEKWIVIPSSLGNWYADPFLFEWEGHRFLFAERMNRWRLIGSIAVCEIKENGDVTQFREVLSEPFHLSYPNVFEHDGEVYMIPESGWNKDIRLYNATDFPIKWELVKILVKGANYVDTSFLTEIENDKAILNSYNWDTRKSCFFELDFNALELKRLPDNSLMLNERNGGNAFTSDGVNYRVLQDCTEHYGSKVVVRRIDNTNFADGQASDSPFLEILPEDLSLNRKWAVTQCHTYNRSEHLEVIDFKKERFVWFGPILCLRNKVFYEHHKDVLSEE